MVYSMTEGWVNGVPDPIARVEFHKTRGWVVVRRRPRKTKHRGFTASPKNTSSGFRSFDFEVAASDLGTGAYTLRVSATKNRRAF